MGLVSFFLLAKQKVILGDYSSEDVFDHLVVGINHVTAAQFVGDVYDFSCYCGVFFLQEGSVVVVEQVSENSFGFRAVVEDEPLRLFHKILA